MGHKDRFINRLNDILIQNNVKLEDRIQVVEDYSDLYEQGIEQGLTDRQVLDKLGNEIEIYNMIKKDLKHEYKTNKATGLMVFISLIIFFVLGNAFKLWTYSWIAFTLIPITAIITNTNLTFRKKIPGLTTFITPIIYFILVNTLNIYHPLWLVFLLIPISGIITHTKLSKMPVALSPFISLSIYILISYFYNDFYKIGWLIFLSIPFLGVLTPPLNKYRYGLAAVILLSVLLYLINIELTGEYIYGLFIFLLPISLAILTSDGLTIKSLQFKTNKSKLLSLVILAILIIYFVVSTLTNSWEITWIILLLIPVAGIYKATKFTRLIPYIPFISLMAFMLVINYIPNSSSWAWLIFLSIPMVGIIEGDNYRLENDENRPNFREDNDLSDYDEKM